MTMIFKTFQIVSHSDIFYVDVYTNSSTPEVIATCDTYEFDKIP